MPTLADTAALVYVADLVRDALNSAVFAGTFGEGVDFQAERSYADWDLKLEDADTLHVDVVPVGHQESQLDSHGSVAYQVAVDIGIRKRFGQAETEATDGRVELAEIDRLVWLVEQIHELACGWGERELADDVTWRTTSISDTYVRQHLRELRQFTGLMRLTFNVRRELSGP